MILNRPLIWALVASVGVCMLVGLAPSTPPSGIIVSKHIEPEHTTEIMTMVGNVPVMMPVTVSEKYCFMIQEDGEEKLRETCKEGSKGKKLFDTLGVGAYLSNQNR